MSNAPDDDGDLLTIAYLDGAADARDKIKSLQSRIASLEEAAKGQLVVVSAAKDAIRERDELKAENERLRKALEPLARAAEEVSGLSEFRIDESAWPGSVRLPTVREILAARAALDVSCS